MLRKAYIELQTLYSDFLVVLHPFTNAQRIGKGSTLAVVSKGLVRRRTLTKLDCFLTRLPVVSQEVEKADRGALGRDECDSYEVFGSRWVGSDGR